MKKMSKIIFGFCIVGFCLMFSFGTSATYAQTSVLQGPCPKATLLEEYTGMGCGNCPDGAEAAAKLKDLRKDKLYIIGIHAGHYAEPSGTNPDYRTLYGDSLLLLAGEYGYPQATIDRCRFPEYDRTIMAMGRGNWTKATKKSFSDTATVNLWSSSTLDASTRVLTIKVEGYYYRSSDAPTNMLNVALVQNHIIGPQNQGGEDYSHEHVLRDLITGCWGDTIRNVEKGSHFEKTYTYTVPADYKNVAVDLRNLELVVFVCESKENILQVTGCKPTLTGFNDPLKVKILSYDLPSRFVGQTIPLKLRSFGSDTIKDISYDAVINGKTETHTINCMVPPYQDAVVPFILDPYIPIDINELSFKITKLNGEANENEALRISFKGAINCVSPIHIEMRTDTCGDEVLWYVKDREGKHIFDFGPYPSGIQTKENQDLEIPEGLYTVVLYDTWWDGYLEGVRGQYKIKDGEDKLVIQSYEILNKGVEIPINVVISSATDVKEKNNSDYLFKAYPNPVIDKVVVSGRSAKKGVIKFVLCDFTGKQLVKKEVFSEKSQKITQEISLQQYPKGLYLLRVEGDNINQTIKITKN